MANGFTHAPIPVNEPVQSYAPGSPEKTKVKVELARQKKQVLDIPVYVGGERHSTGQKVPVVCPHDHSHVLAQVNQATPELVQAAVTSAEEGRRAWAVLPWEERAAVFLKAADLLATKYRAEMNAATMLGQSKTVHQAEIDASCELIDFFRFNVAYMTKIFQEQPLSPFGQWNRSEARGLEGFVYAVTPFNFTSIAVNLPATPALMGCSVIWKPAATSMHSAWVGLRILEEAGLPPGVINMVPGNAAEISRALLASPNLAGIHFTGSTATFNSLWKDVGTNIAQYRTYPRLVGETGGKDFVFAHPSADVDQLVTALVRGAFEYQGQKCSAASRAYIPRSLWSQLKEKLVTTTNSLKMGSPEDFTNFMAAVIDARAFKKITSYIDRARQSSEAKVIAGGEYDGSKGFFIRPTIIEATNPRYETMVEELFGPVLTVYVYEDARFEDTLKLCDESTPYALTGAIFAKDRRVIHAMTEKLAYAAGNFYINDKPTGAVVGQQPFGGSRASGTNDKAGSIYNLLRWTSHRSIKENFLAITQHEYPFMGEP